MDASQLTGCPLTAPAGDAGDDDDIHSLYEEFKRETGYPSERDGSSPPPVSEWRRS